MKAKVWGAFALLGLIWGSSFLWIRIAVQDIGPFTLVAFRLLFGFVGIGVIAIAKKQSFPRDRKTLMALAVMAILNIALPFTLISWGETTVESSLASILNGTVPLFSIVIAHYWLHDEKITLPRILGLVLGFCGVFVLVGRGFDVSALSGNVLGQMAIVAAALSYAVSASYARRNLQGQPPLLQSMVTLLVADLILWISIPVVGMTAPALNAPNQLPTLAITWIAIAWLGLLGSCVAFLLFFYLLNHLGATRTTLVTYIFPVVGLVLGIVFLDEPMDWRLGIGSALILSGIVIVNLKADSLRFGRGQGEPVNSDQ
jgi:drug/metabolite transporter (DMT)-like permease